MDSVMHFEIPADDLPGAKKFYGSIFGWKIGDVPGMGYSMARTTEVDEKTGMPKMPGRINGGMMKRMPNIKGPVITITVDDAKKALDKVKKAGGKVLVEPQKVMDMGWNAYAMDTEGNVIVVWQPAIKE